MVDGTVFRYRNRRDGTSFDYRPSAPPVPGDANGDGLVNVSDLLAVINAWGACQPLPAACPADVTHDGSVSVNDLLLVLTHWG